MATDRKRIVEVRLIVIVLVDLTEADLKDALAASGGQPSLAQVIASEVASNLESVPYVESVIVSPL